MFLQNSAFSWIFQPSITSSVFLFSSTLIPILLFYLAFSTIDSVIRDYRAFLSLGPGGTPSTPHGYLRIKFLSLFALKDRYSPTLQATAPALRGRLRALTARAGPRPTVAGIAPHRQRNQRASPESFAALRAGIEAVAARRRARLKVRTSCLEKHGPGLFVVPAGAWGELTSRQRCGGEACHAHPSDGSLHLTLHPADEAAVLKAG